MSKFMGACRPKACSIFANNSNSKHQQQQQEKKGMKVNTLNLVTPEPTSETMPVISWPGTHGYLVFFHSLSTWCRSEWQMPQCATCMQCGRSATSQDMGLIGVERLKHQ